MALKAIPDVPAPSDPASLSRYRWLEDWAKNKQNVAGASIRSVKELMVEKFGMALANRYVSQVLNKARMEHGIDTPKGGYAPSFTSNRPPSLSPELTAARPSGPSLQLSDIFRALEALGIKGVNKQDDGSWGVKV